MRVGMDHKVGELGEDDIDKYDAKDLANHKERGKPYSIIKDEIVGRHMVATRNIKAGEIIMEDMPLTFGPVCSTGVKPMCLGCYRHVDGSVCCETCGWPMCSVNCSNKMQHRDQECQMFKDIGFKVDTEKLKYKEIEPAYSCISPLRALSLQKSDPDRWSMIWSLMSHNEARRKEEYWTTRHTPVIKYIRETIGLKEYSEDLIDTVLGIFLVNDFEINAKIGEDEWSSASNDSIRGLFQIASIPNHDCVANTVHQFGPLEENFRMIVRASRDIKKGEEITHSYVDTQEPFLIRQELLNLGKFFHCLCARCSDPTELETYSSALKCPACKEPVITTSTKDLKADWACTKCKKVFPHLKISNVTAAIKEESELLEYDKEHLELCDIPAHEAFLKKFSPILYPKHVLLIKAKYTLAKMYGRMSGYEADKLSNEQLLRKQALCEEVLSVLNKIMPGQSRMRGVMLYELHLPCVMLANRQLQLGPGSGADPKQIKAGLKKGLQSLKQGLNILKLQPPGSFESKIVAGSQKSLVELETWVKTISEAL